MDLETLSEETLAFVKSQTSGILSTTGIYGVDLSGLVSLIPVVTPFRNQLPREASPEGAPQATWRSLQNVNNLQASPSVTFDYAAPLVQVDMLNVSAPYQPIGMAGRVTQDSMDLGKSYSDVLAVETLNTLNQLMIGEDKLLIGASNFALQTAGQPTGTAFTTGGSIGTAASTIQIRVSAKTGANYFYGGGGIGSTASTAVTTGTSTSTNSVAYTWPAVKGAMAYDVFVTFNAGVNYYYYTTTTTNTALITAVISANNPVPATLPNLYGVAPTSIPVTDGTGVSSQFNGLTSSIVGDYLNGGISTPGSGQASGAYYSSNDGTPLTASNQGIAELDALNLSIWNSVNLSPSCYMMSSQQASDITGLLLATGQAYTLLQPDDASGRSNISAGGYVSTYLNRAAGGQRIRIEVHPNMVDGTIVARTDRVPFPGANISNVWSVRTLRDYSQFNYGSNYNPGVVGGGPRTDFEIRSVETLINRAPTAQGVISNISNG